MNIDISIRMNSFLLTFSIENRIINFSIFFKGKTLVMFHKEFIKYYKCAMCGEKTEDEGSKLKLCEDHQHEVLLKVREKLKDELLSNS